MIVYPVSPSCSLAITLYLPWLYSEPDLSPPPQNPIGVASLNKIFFTIFKQVSWIFFLDRCNILFKVCKWLYLVIMWVKESICYPPGFAKALVNQWHPTQKWQRLKGARNGTVLLASPKLSFTSLVAVANAVDWLASQFCLGYAFMCYQVW